MTLQEAIEKEKSIAKSNHELAESYHRYFENTFMRQEGACRERAEYHEQVAEWLEELQKIKEQKAGCCKWVKYDYRTICPSEHDIDNPYWRIPEKRMDVLKYCPYCGKEIEVTE